MIGLRRGAERGRFRNHWLDARFSFSFGAYRETGFDGWSDLMVLNDDRVAPGRGFANHPHSDVEVMSYPLAGAVAHRDSLGNVATLRPGDVHLMRAGRFIEHSEMNASATEPEHHLQWWIRPAERGLDPAYARIHVAPHDKRGRWRVLAAPDGAEGSRGALVIAQDARVLSTWLDGESIDYRPPPGRWTYLHLAQGRALVQGFELEAGDALRIRAEPTLRISAAPGAPADVLLFDLRPGA